MSVQNENEATNSGYGSSDETASLLVVSTANSTTIVAAASPRTIPKIASINGPTAASTSTSTASGPAKPILTRQECTTSSYLISPSHTMGGSEESGGLPEDEPRQHQHQQRTVNATSVPDIDTQCRLEAPTISISGSCRTGHRGSVSGYQLTPQIRCRTCRTCDRRASTTPVSSLQLARSVSKDSVRSSIPGHLSPYSISVQQHIPPVLITSSPNSGSRIIRQSSQPEASNIVCCSSHSCSHNAPSVSLRQLREPSEGIAGIAADSLRINGAMRPFRQVSPFISSDFAADGYYILYELRGLCTVVPEAFSRELLTNEVVLSFIYPFHLNLFLSYRSFIHTRHLLTFIN